MASREDAQTALQHEIRKYAGMLTLPRTHRPGSWCDDGNDEDGLRLYFPLYLPHTATTPPVRRGPQGDRCSADILNPNAKNTAAGGEEGGAGASA